MMVGLDDLVPARKPSQLAVCTVCRWRGIESHDAPRLLAKLEHEDRTGHKVEWVDAERDDG